ncbi:MAG: hypothetical protein FJ272_16740, partial [Planctomycetes bacterium]|nr:hypothetical protein [Planctomycetota bacterium]
MFVPARTRYFPLAMFVLLLAMPVGAAENLLRNGGFEEAGARPPHWGTEDWGKRGAKNVYGVDAKVFHQGGRAACIEVVEPGAVGTWHQWFREPVEHQGYMLRAWVKCENAAAGSGIICDGGTAFGERPWARTDGTHDWKLLEVHNIRVKPGNPWLLVSLVCRGGKMWFDDVELVAEERPAQAPGTITAFPVLAQDGKTVDFVVVLTEHAEVRIARRGGKIVSWWDVQSKRELVHFEPTISLSGTAKDFPPELGDSKLWDGPFDLQVRRQEASVEVTARQELSGGLG